MIPGLTDYLLYNDIFILKPVILPDGSIIRF